MATKARQTKRNRGAQAVRIHNPAEGGATLLLTGRRNNMAKRKGKKKGGRRRNSTKRNTAQVRTATTGGANVTTRKSNKARRPRRRNTGDSSFATRMRNVGSSGPVGLVVAGVGIIGFDMIANKFLGQQAALPAAAVKIGGGFVLAQNGRKLPMIGKHAELIGAVLIVNGVVDALRILVLPRVVQYLPQALLPTPPVVAALPAAAGMGGFVNIPQNSPLRLYRTAD